MGYSGAGGKLIHEKTRSKNLATPFNCMYMSMYFIFYFVEPSFSYPCAQLHSTLAD
jgi:hypothetical protein